LAADVIYQQFLKFLLDVFVGFNLPTLETAVITFLDFFVRPAGTLAAVRLRFVALKNAIRRGAGAAPASRDVLPVARPTGHSLRTRTHARGALAEAYLATGPPTDDSETEQRVVNRKRTRQNAAQCAGSACASGSAMILCECRMHDPIRPHERQSAQIGGSDVHLYRLF
jgi:hypothetical protein